MLMYKTHVLADLLHACQFQHPFCVQSPFSACLDHGFWAFFNEYEKKTSALRPPGRFIFETW